MSKNTASIMAVLGASGSGKSAFVKQLLARTRPRRLMVWDAMREYAHLGAPVANAGDLVHKIKAAGARGGFCLVFVPSADPKVREVQFSLWCRAALAAGNVTALAEELRFVTKPSHAPMGWAQLTMTGRHKGCRVIGTSQRPASIDKDFFGNCTAIHTGRLAYPEDVRTVARAMQVPEDALQRLQPLDWIEKDMATGKLTRGRLTF